LSQRKSAAVALGVTALLAPSLAACSGGDDDSVDNQAVCVDEQTQERVPDDQCNEDGSRASSGIGGSAFLWYFLGTTAGRGFPGIGQRVSGGTFTQPSGSFRRGGVPSAGGNVPRGGFGGGTKAGSSGG
jgi:hypothetical protein